MGKAHELVGDVVHELAGRTPAYETLMAAYLELTGAGTTTRAAARLTGVSRATATRKLPAVTVPRVRVAPANKVSVLEQARILAVVNSPRFVDLPPIQIYARLLDEGIYLGSISSIYRVLTENTQVKERRRLARHPARAIPELVATGPGQVYSWDITKLQGPIKGKYYDCYVMIDIFSRYIVGAHVHSSESAIPISFVTGSDQTATLIRTSGTPPATCRRS